MFSDNNMVMPVAPSMGNDGFFGGDGIWAILIFALLFGGFGNGFGGYGGDNLYPWMNQADITTSGFQNAATNSAISSLQNSVISGFGDVQNSLCGGFAGVNTNISNGFAQAEISENARQMANMNQMYGIQSSLQNCCCENRSNIADLKYTVATENCADRQALSDGVRDILTNQNSNTQKILDQMCADKIDAKNEKIADLERRLTMANLSASQIAQTSQILADNSRQTVALEQYLNPTPVPAYVVQNPNCCSQTCGCVA